MFTHERDARVHRHSQRKGSWPGVQLNERVCIPRGEYPRQCRPVHRGRPAHTQRIVQLPEVHSQTVRPTERLPQAQTPDAKSQRTRDSAVRRLRNVELVRVPLQYAAPSPPQPPDSLHRLAKEQNRTDHSISYLDKLVVKMESESLEVIIRGRRIPFAGFVACMECTRLSKCVMFGELVGV